MRAVAKGQHRPGVPDRDIATAIAGAAGAAERKGGRNSRQFGYGVDGERFCERRAAVAAAASDALGEDADRVHAGGQVERHVVQRDRGCRGGSAGTAAAGDDRPLIRDSHGPTGSAIAAVPAERHCGGEDHADRIGVCSPAIAAAAGDALGDHAVRALSGRDQRPGIGNADIAARIA